MKIKRGRVVSRERVVVFCSATMGEVKIAEAGQTAISLCFSCMNRTGAKPCIQVAHVCALMGICHRQS